MIDYRSDAAGVPLEVVAELLGLYDPDLAYHNADHALAVRRHALRYAADAARSGERLDVTVVELAALAHDAGYRADPGDRTRERYAADLSGTVLDRAGYSTRVIDAVTVAVLATEHDAAPSTVEGRVVRAADLADLAAPYPVFAANTRLLHAEATLLAGAPVPAVRWRADVARVVGGYLAAPPWLPLDPGGADPAAAWRGAVADNLARYARDETRHAP